MLIKIFYSVIFFLLFFSFNASAVEISAEKAVVMNADTGEVIFEKNSRQKASMASTTKIMTGLIAIESGCLGQHVTATDSVLAEGTSIGLKSGDTLTLESLVYGMMLESGNDAANLCALSLGGDYKSFSEMMNEKAREIGMNDTNFVTPSGLDDELHFTTAYDMALLGAYSIENPVFREIFSTKKKKITFLNPEKSVVFSNHNRLLGSCEGVFGIKTGFTKKSGRCLVTACERGGATLICVTLNAPNDWNDHSKLYDYSFADINTSKITALNYDYVRVYGSEKTELKVKCNDYQYFYNNSDSEITKRIYIPEIIYAPVRKNDILGCVSFLVDGKVIGKENIYAAEDAFSVQETYKKNRTLINKLTDFISERIKR